MLDIVFLSGLDVYCIHTTPYANMNILIVEDEVPIALFVQRILKKVSVSNLIDTAQGFQEAFSKLFSDIFDVVIIDIDLGKEKRTGIDLCEIIRSRDKYIPIIILTGFHSLSYIEKSFLAGANDYITKPFRPRELELRVERWKKISNRKKVEQNMEYEELSYDIQKNEFFFKHEKLNLTKRNKELLLLFLKNPESMLSSQYIRAKFWGDSYDTQKSRNLRSNIHLLRNSLENKCGNWIHTTRGEGYILQKNFSKYNFS